VNDGVTTKLASVMNVDVEEETWHNYWFSTDFETNDPVSTDHWLRI
jgi:hypothetical protein